MLTLDGAIPGLENMAGSATLYVGVQDGAKNDRTGANVAEYAAYNEFGTATIPARPAMRETVDTYLDAYVEGLADMLMAGKDPAQALDSLGMQMAGDISQSIRDWTTPANAPATEARKGVNNPLVDTETYANSIDSRVEQGA
jgi:hypothetical protein